MWNEIFDFLKEYVFQITTFTIIISLITIYYIINNFRLNSQDHQLNQRLSNQNRVEELAEVNDQVRRIAAIKYQRFPKIGAIDYRKYIREGILEDEIIDNIFMKINKYNLNIPELMDLYSKARRIIRSGQINYTDALNLITLSKTISQHLKIAIAQMSIEAYT